MQALTFDRLAAAFAIHRATGTLFDLPPDAIRSDEEAAAIQLLALEAYDDDFDGYALLGTSAAAQRMLGLDRPIFSAIAQRANFTGVERFKLPAGTMGAQCELAFTFSRAYPAPGELINRRSAATAIVACQPVIGLIGRRIVAPPDRATMIADFALHVATLSGRAAEGVDLDTLDQTLTVARIDDQTVVTATGSAIIGHPLEAVVWLARALARDGRRIEAGDIVTTGSAAPILQVLPGQHLAVAFGSVGEVACAFE